MQDNEPSQRVQERRRARRQRELKWLLVGVAFVVGVILGWVVIGWNITPPHPSDLRDLNPNAKIDYVALVVDSWSLTRDTALAQERLRDLDRQELTSILGNLNAKYDNPGETQQAARVRAFAAAYGVKLENGATALDASPTPTGTPPPTRTPTSIHLAVAPNITGTLRAAVENWAETENISAAPPGEGPISPSPPTHKPGRSCLPNASSWSWTGSPPFAPGSLNPTCAVCGRAKGRATARKT